MKFVTECTKDLTSKVQGVVLIGSKTIPVLSIDDLVSQLTSVPKPAVGVLYEGARPVSAEGGKQVMVSAEVVFSLLLLTETSSISPKVDLMTPTHEALDQLRYAIHGTRSPTGHFWKWVLEAPAVTKGSFQVWVQRWSCPVQLPPPQR